MTLNPETETENTGEMINQTEERREETTPPNPIREDEVEGRKLCDKSK